MKKISFCDGWLFGETGKKKQPVLLPHDATQTQRRSADAPSGSGGKRITRRACWTFAPAWGTPCR